MVRVISFKVMRRRCIDGLYYEEIRGCEAERFEMHASTLQWWGVMSCCVCSYPFDVLTWASNRIQMNVAKPASDILCKITTRKSIKDHHDTYIIEAK